MLPAAQQADWWSIGGVSCSEWTGVLVADVLKAVGVRLDAAVYLAWCVSMLVSFFLCCSGAWLRFIRVCELRALGVEVLTSERTIVLISVGSM
jgi:hypothetical protein